ncbi:hypothetical protein HDU76_011452, partial [Blyttiomyces sp. JEL0837]
MLSTNAPKVLTTITFLLLAAIPHRQVEAHGRMKFPYPRLYPGDDNAGYTYARTANKDPCQGLPPGPPKTAPLTGGAV